MFAWTVWAAWACHLGWLQMDQIVGLRETWVVFKSLTPSRTWFLPTPHTPYLRHPHPLWKSGLKTDAI